MENILLNVDYTGNENYWSDSNIKQGTFSIDPEKNIHNQISEILKDKDFCELSYNNKPQSNIYVDLKDGGHKAIGYVYRGKIEIYNDDLNKYVTANFDVWVTIKKVEDYKIQIID